MTSRVTSRVSALGPALLVVQAELDGKRSLLDPDGRRPNGSMSDAGAGPTARRPAAGVTLGAAGFLWVGEDGRHH